MTYVLLFITFYKMDILDNNLNDDNDTDSDDFQVILFEMEYYKHANVLWRMFESR